MDILIALILLVIVFLIITGRNDLSAKLRELEARIIDLQSQLRDAAREQGISKVPATPPRVSPPPPLPERPPLPKPVIETPRPEPEKPVEVEWQAKVIAEPVSPIQRPAKTYDAPRPVYKEPEPTLSFFERYPDLEKFIGENIISKIGITFVVLGIAYFVKWAVDNNYIGPVGRVGIGILCGAILIGFAHWLRNSYKAFSSVLAGGGLAVFYFTITLAFHQFHLFNQTVAFIILIGITIFSVALSLLYDRQELAMIALVGGLSSPFMVSTGQANYNALFIYLLILNCGLLVLAYFKAWRILNISAFILTALVFGGVIYTLTGPTYHVGFIYASIFYLLFFCINIANNLKEGKSFVASDFGILLANTTLYFSAGLYLLTMMNGEQYRGAFCASLAAVNLVLSYLLFKSKRIDTNVLYLLIGITLTFISLTAPLQLHGHYITLFWASEAVLLYWLHQKSGIILMKLTSMIVYVVMLVSLLIDLISIYSGADHLLIIIVNKGFITILYAALSSWLMYVLLKRDDNASNAQIPSPPKMVYQIIALVLLFLSGLLEINYQFLFHYPNTELNVIYNVLYITAFVSMFNALWGWLKGNDSALELRMGLVMASAIVFLVSISRAFGLQAGMLEHGQPTSGHFAAHWLAAVLMLALLYNLICIIRDYFAETVPQFVTWIICGYIVVLLSLEVGLLNNMMFYGPAHSLERLQTVYIQTGLPVLWGLLSFGLMWLGMRHKARMLRVISLSLFTLTLLKFFVFDIRNIPQVGKIAAFFCLGVLLLIVSFMYQKVKKIIADDEDKLEG